MESNREEKYKLINDVLNNYFLDINDTFFDKHLYDFFLLALKVEEIIDQNDSMYIGDPRIYRLQNPEYNRLTEYLSYSDSMQIVRDYLAERLPQYARKFEECLNNGIINIVAAPDDDYTEDKRNHQCYSKERNKYHANMVLEHNYFDPSTIMHEFMHYLNCYSGEEPLTRKLLTETISIFFESDILKYMEEKGYNKSDIAKVLHWRIENTRGLLLTVALDIAMLYNFKHLGNLSDKSLTEAQELDLKIRRKTQEEYLKSVDNYTERIKNDNNAPHVLVGYLLGTVIALASLEKNDPNIAKRFAVLNESVNSKSFEECIKIIDIDISKKGFFQELLGNFRQSIVKIDEATKLETYTNFKIK